MIMDNVTLNEIRTERCYNFKYLYEDNGDDKVDSSFNLATIVYMTNPTDFPIMPISYVETNFST